MNGNKINKKLNSNLQDIPEAENGRLPPPETGIETGIESLLDFDSSDVVANIPAPPLVYAPRNRG